MTDLPRTWLEKLLGVDAAGAGEGTVWSLEHAWSLAPWITLLLLIGVVLFVVFIYSREGSTVGRAAKALLIGLRISALAVVLFMIARFVLSLERTGLPYVVVLVDDSASMGVADQYDDATAAQLAERLRAVDLAEPHRLNLAKSVLLADDAALLERIERRFRLKLYYLAASPRAEPAAEADLRDALRGLAPNGAASRLGDGLRTVLNDLRGAPPAACIVLSDGVTTEGEPLADAAAYAGRKGVPIFTVALGSGEPIRDLEISDLLVDEVVFVDDVVNFEIMLKAAGYEGRQVELSLHQQGSDEKLASTKVALKADGQPEKHRLSHRPSEPGEFEYIVRVESLDDEIQHDNNAEQRAVSVRKEQIRVLLVDSQPRFEFRRLKDMLDRDRAIDVKTVLQNADLEYTETDRTALRVFPIRREDLFEFDVVLFGDVDPSFLSTSVMTNLSDFVTQKGGGLIFVAGPRFLPTAYERTPLAKLMPIEPQAVRALAGDEPATVGFRPQPTPLGWASPALQLGDDLRQSEEIWRNLPELYWYVETPRLKPAARVLVEHPSRVGDDGRPAAIVSMQYVGAGKVLFHATDETWRWRYRTGDRHFARYWVQTIRFLARSKLVGQDRSAELSVDRRQYQRGDTARLRVRFADDRLAPSADDGVVVMLEREGDRNRRVVLRRNAASRGVFEGEIAGLADGTYHAWIATPTLAGEAPTADFRVAAPPGEFHRVRSDFAALRQASQRTHGRFHTIETAHRLVDDLPQGRQVPVERLPPVALWNQWPVVFVFLALLISEWIVRKRKGLL